MLIYNQAFDLHHGVFRVLQILSASPGIEFEVSKLRLLDFLLLFPEQLEKVRVPAGSMTGRNLFTREDNPYRSLDNPYRLFVELGPLQQEALYALAAHEIIDLPKLKRDYVARTAKPLPPALAETITVRNAQTQHLIDIISKDLGQLPMFGANGLKERTRFLTLRHEIV
jgi:hypothetical protein